VSEEIEQKVSWRDYVDARFSSMQQAVTKAEAATEARFAGVNEFRAQLADQTRTLMPRLEAEEKFKSMEKVVTDLTARVNAREDRGRGMGDVWAYIVGAVGFLFGVVGIVSFIMRVAR
jgi:hypothetical protein